MIGTGDKDYCAPFTDEKMEAGVAFQSSQGQNMAKEGLLPVHGSRAHVPFMPFFHPALLGGHQDHPVNRRCPPTFPSSSPTDFSYPVHPGTLITQGKRKVRLPRGSWEEGWGGEGVGGEGTAQALGMAGVSHSHF